MSCPDWTELTRGDVPVSADAWAHAETCQACRETAIAADPLLAFRRLPQVEADHDDVTRMQQAVAAMRRGRTVEEQAGPERTPVVSLAPQVPLAPRARGRVSPRIQTLGLAAAALVAVLLPARWIAVPEAGSTVRVEHAIEAPSIASVAQDDTAWLRSQLANEPPIEGAKGLEVIQIANDDEMDLVLVFTNTTEVARLDV